jgi:hypothetical protein
MEVIKISDRLEYYHLLFDDPQSTQNP